VKTDEGDSKYRNVSSGYFLAMLIPSTLHLVLDQPPPAPRREHAANRTREQGENTRDSCAQVRGRRQKLQPPVMDAFYPSGLPTFTAGEPSRPRERFSLQHLVAMMGLDTAEEVWWFGRSARST
jgi:hypothetical protein